ncbi:MAG: methyltransferase domain-containing protein [Verrucomicrobiae bacterium]|nr:methyltransferase domain-containing protein [Verrucomicrobiae bacterium]
MSLFAPKRRFDAQQPEMMDQPGVDPELVREELRALERANRRLGGHRLMLHYVAKLLGPARRPSVNILDLGTGSADIPRAIVAWARRERLPVTVVAVDANPVALDVARAACRDWPEIRLEQHDLRALPYAAESFDLVLCSLALHHFGNAEAQTILQRIHALARVGCIVNDLRRNWLTIVAAVLMARTVLRNPVTRNDVPQSCRAAFTVGELRTMAMGAGLRRFQIHRHHGCFHMVLEGRK